MNFTAIDFETANRARASACSIGLVKVRDGEIVDTYYRLLTPEKGDFEYVNISIHGITPDQVEGKPTLTELWPEIETFISNDVLIGHNVMFEQSVINQSFIEKGLPTPKLDYLCTLYMARVSYPRRLSYKLDELCKDLLGKEVNHHHALEDAAACAELALHHINKYREKEPRNIIKFLYVIPVSQKKEWMKLTGIKPSKEELDPNHVLFDKKIVITGALSKSSREKAVMSLVDKGGIYQEAITKATDYLVVGDVDFNNLSSKHRKAIMMRDTGGKIQILTEGEFWGMVID